MTHRCSNGVLRGRLPWLPPVGSPSHTRPPHAVTNTQRVRAIELLDQVYEVAPHHSRPLVRRLQNEIRRN